ncbi:hypothetical protein RFI_39441 [Reticulomyxa filosa]|uniref:Kelch motif family protein n=1 Tax=Reticulomyxa filosa TaxID=46433 RepID=X6LAB9_RETFI|nr:hypothetical protein RFI_39441 [Reticulomyxa filosa]|eukprot:ETN98081.1 hypothetical protein RFI_39441 [Reticulomyxa filosa]
MSNKTFQTLKVKKWNGKLLQCVINKHELLICGGYEQRACYSYHTIKNEYKFICYYPNHVQLKGHCVVKLVDNNNKDRNQITLLSFGGAIRHTLLMKYVSVWSNKSNISNKLNKSNDYNEWIPFTDNHNHPIIIGRERDNYWGARAVIGGRNSHLLFITYTYNYISVFDLNTFQYIKHDTLPTDSPIWCHCFVSNSENVQGQEMMKTNKQNYQILLFKCNIGLSIEYDEDNNTFQFHQLPVCDDIAQFYYYAYVCINDIIFFFGGWNGMYGTDANVSKSVHKYSIRENKWTTFQNMLPSPLYDCIAILSEEDNHIHIIGGQNYKHESVPTYMKIKVRELDPSLLSKNEVKFIVQYWIRTLKIKLGWIADFDKIIMKYVYKINFEETQLNTC